MIHSLRDKRQISAIRVSLMEGGGSGPFLGLSLDEAKPQDESFKVQGLIFIVDKYLLKQCGTINIDFIEAGNNSGFKITTTNPIIATNDNCRKSSHGTTLLCH